MANEIIERDDIQVLEKFILNYNQDSFDKIKFKWNGQHAADFEDSNYKFRELVTFYLLTKYDNTENSMLLKDLFCEQSKCNRETWSVSSYLFLIGERLLIVNGKEYILEFLESAMRTMDTYLNCIYITISPELLHTITKEIEQLKEAAEGDPFYNRLLENGIEYVKNFVK